MSEFYDDMAAMVTELAGSDLGQDGIAIHVYTEGGGPPHNPLPPAYDKKPVDGFAEGVSAHHLQDSLIQSSDVIVTVGAGIIPKMQDKVSIGDDLYTIVKIDRTPMAGTPVSFDIFIRR